MSRKSRILPPNYCTTTEDQDAFTQKVYGLISLYFNNFTLFYFLFFFFLFFLFFPSNPHEICRVSGGRSNVPVPPTIEFVSFLFVCQRSRFTLFHFTTFRTTRRFEKFKTQHGEQEHARALFRPDALVPSPPMKDEKPESVERDGESLRSRRRRRCRLTKGHRESVPCTAHRLKIANFSRRITRIKLPPS